MERTNATAPAINVIENDNNYCVEVAAPGMTKDDFNIKLMMTTTSLLPWRRRMRRKKGRKNGRYLRREFSYSKFQQAMILPDDVDRTKISAKVNNGVLEVELPKLPEEEKRKPR